jgi:hypothetical protein
LATDGDFEPPQPVATTPMPREASTVTIRRTPSSQADHSKAGLTRIEPRRLASSVPRRGPADRTLVSHQAQSVPPAPACVTDA